MPPDVFAELKEPLADLGRLWAASRHRPRPSEAILQQWDLLLQRWAESDLPVLLRVSGRRDELARSTSGRAILFGDNTPAWWSFGLAMAGEIPDISGWSLASVKECVPLSMLARRQLTHDPNRDGWKVCHIKSVSDRTRAKVEGLDDVTLRARFVRFISPRNMFLVPKTHSGLGELPEVIAAIRHFEGL